jgi:AAA domain, putative AbiEii toxin, Type IV TA system
VSGIVREVVVRGFRSAGDARFAPGPLCALVGEADSGKSNLLAALRAALDPEAAPVTQADLMRDGVAAQSLEVRVRLAGGVVRLYGAPPETHWSAGTDHLPPLLFLPAVERGQRVLAPGSRGTSKARLAVELLERATGGSRSDSAGACALAAAVEAWCEAGLRGLVVLIEEPELFLAPQAQRHLYRLLRRLAAGGNQVIYSTHSPAFLNVVRLDELLFVRRADGRGATYVHRPQPIGDVDELRVQSEFDANRTELFLARSAVLVEGLTERLALPFVFASLGIDPDREGISIIECGGKTSMPLIAEIGRAAGIPLVVVHDRDAPDGRHPSPTHRRLNAQIARVAGAGHTVVLSPDFEGVAGLRGHDHKPREAWRRFAALPASAMPEPLIHAALLAARLAERNPT